MTYRAQSTLWEFPKLGVPYFGVLIIRILLFRLLYEVPLFFLKLPYEGLGLGLGFRVRA